MITYITCETTIKDREPTIYFRETYLIKPVDKKMDERSYLFALCWQKIDESLNDTLGHGQAFLFAGFVQAQVHEQGGGVLQAVGGGSLNFVQVPDQPLNYAAGNQLFAYIAPRLD